MKIVRAQRPDSVAPWFPFSNLMEDDFWSSDYDVSGGMNMWEDDHKVYVEVAVPGMKEDDLDVTLENGVLTVRGAKESKDEQKEGAKKVYSASMKSSFYYSTTLPSNAGHDVDASLEDGVLKLDIPKAEEAKPKKIEVKRK